MSEGSNSGPEERETRKDLAPITDLDVFGLGHQERIYGDEQHHDCNASQDRGAQLSPEEASGQDNLQEA